MKNNIKNINLKDNEKVQNNKDENNIIIKTQVNRNNDIKSKNNSKENGNPEKVKDKENEEEMIEESSKVSYHKREVKIEESEVKAVSPNDQGTIKKNIKKEKPTVSKPKATPKPKYSKEQKIEFALKKMGVTPSQPPKISNPVKIENNTKIENNVNITDNSPPKGIPPKLVRRNSPPKIVKGSLSRTLSKTKKNATKHAQQETTVDISNTNVVRLFSHLSPQYEKIYMSYKEELKTNIISKEIHHSIMQIAYKYSDRSLTGSNSRCIALLEAFRDAINDFDLFKHGGNNLRGSTIFVWSTSFEQYQKKQIQFVSQFRPISIPMGNAINFLKKKISELNGKSEKESKEYLIDQIDKFINERIVVADELISKYGEERIVDGDVIVVYGASSVVEKTIVQAYSLGKKFEIVIVDSRPNLEGKSILKNLTKQKIPCTYVFLNAISYVMKRTTKVFLGAYSLLSNGNMVSRCGSSMVAMMAKEYNIPVLLCCETYKFSEKVRLDSICENELADPLRLLTSIWPEDTSISKYKDNENLQLLNLVYDLTPMEFVTMVITEFGVIPPSSCYVVIREYNYEENYLL
eukprot:TRINITY_DN5688_c0_g1_i2.p1 TRINITY_DN5688_c0_g1~~TRINITY_DN5688_c0_g1_i2.p1  ORF type:complete len:677 (-),score=206.34 TRINITY_DN5688_c0_g1_i2:2-1732(-)